MRPVYGVLAAVAVAPLLVILWYALGVLAFALSVGSGPAWWVYVIYWGGTAGLVVLDAGLDIWLTGSVTEKPTHSDRDESSLG